MQNLFPRWSEVLVMASVAGAVKLTTGVRGYARAGTNDKNMVRRALALHEGQRLGLQGDDERAPAQAMVCPLSTKEANP